MEDKLYPIPENPKYNTQIRALKDSDPARASGVFNPLFEQLIENTHAVKLKGDENEKRIEEVAEEAKQTREASHVKLSDGTTVEDALQGKADLDNNGKVPESQLPKIDYDAKGSANAALIDAKAYTDTSAARTLTAAKAYADTLTPTFIYKCTGKADSTAIAKIVNKFLDSGTAMNMSLKITGTMGVAFTNNYAIYLNPKNSRGARVFLDFSDCYIPEITTEQRSFLWVKNINLDILGLVTTTTEYCLACTGAGIYSLKSCVLKGKIGVYCPGGFAGILNILDSCKIIGSKSGVQSDTSNTNAVIKLTDSQLTDAYQSQLGSTMHWIIKGCSFAASSMRINNTSVTASTTVANAYLAIQAYHNLFSQTIN